MTALIADDDFVLHVGDVRDVLQTLPDESVDCCVTSPPYWGLRDYGEDAQIGLEATPDVYVGQLVAVFQQVRRILKPEGTLWLNLGDTYSRNPAKGGSGPNGKHDFIPDYGKAREIVRGKRIDRGDGRWGGGNVAAPGLKEKDMIGIPWRVAFALQEDGWYLRSDIIWAKPNPMPESVTDRPTKAHEYVFLLSKGPRYFYDADAIRELAVGPDRGPGMTRGVSGPHAEQAGLGRRARRTALIPAQTKAGVGSQGTGSETFGHYSLDGFRNARSVWEIATQPYAEAHFATFPEELPRRCILAGCPVGGTVLDPFMGSGTTAKVARDHGRKALGVELNPEYAALCDRRNAQKTIFAEDAA